ncbi:MAG TPA: BACON domain-containing carbohydrate-binding protein [Mycobacteriales bacterium]|nr:BACON domain-containing carbohydrate-binding protein [Mycobacteriales bacterium]
MSRLRRHAAASLALAAACGASGVVWGAPASAVPANAVAQGLGIRLLDAPVALRDDPRARVYIIDHLAPGAVIVRHVEVSNGSAVAHHILVYPDSAEIAGGSFRPDAGHGTNELTSWITVTPTTMDLGPQQQAVATVTIAVPANASSGERYGVILADQPPPASASGLVRSEVRVGIRIYLSVGPGGAPPSDFSISTLTAGRTAAGVPTVAAQVHNSGQRALDMTGSLRLSNGPAGLAAGPFPVQLGTTLAIGDTEPVTVPLDPRLPAGPWLVRLDLRSGLVEHAVTATLTFPTTPGSSAKPVPATPVPLAQRRSVVAPVAGGLVALLALLLALVLWRRRRSQDEPATTAEPGPTR